MIRTGPTTFIIKIDLGFNHKIKYDPTIASKIFSEVMDPRISAVCKYWYEWNNSNYTYSLMLDKYKQQPSVASFTACFPPELMRDNPIEAVQLIFQTVHGIVQISGLQQEVKKLQIQGVAPLDFNRVMEKVSEWNGYNQLTHHAQSTKIAIDLLAVNLFSDDGFIKDPHRDLGYSKKNKQSVSEVQGCRAFCKKTVQYTRKHPAIFSPHGLRIHDHLNKNYLTLKYKRIGHVFDLDAPVYLPDNSLTVLAGCNETFVLPMLRDMFHQFAYARKDLINPQVLEMIDIPLSKAMWHDNASEEKINEIHKLILDKKYPHPVMVGSGWVWHSMWDIFWKNEWGQLFVWHCNRGADHQGKPGIVELIIGKPENITPAFLKKLTARLDVDYEEYTSLEKIKKELFAFESGYIPMLEQSVGNCTYTSLQAAINALFILRGIGHLYMLFSQFDAQTILNDFLLDLQNVDIQKMDDPDYKNYVTGLRVIALLIQQWLSDHLNKENNQPNPFRKVSIPLTHDALKVIREFEIKLREK